MGHSSEKSPDQISFDHESASHRSVGVWNRMVDSMRPVPIPSTNETMTRHERAIHATVDLPLKQVLKPRHLQMIAIGGSIGGGLFISSGNALYQGGPAGMIIGYALIGGLLFSTMTALGEMAVRFPVAGAFSAYSSRFVDYSWGFAIGWLYAFQYLMLLPLELTAAAVVIGFWNTDDNGATNVNKAAWIALFWAVIAFANIFGVRGYGEIEVVLAVIKIAAIIGFIIFGIVITCGGGPTHEYIGGRYWRDPGAFSNGFKGVCEVFVSAAYAFAGTELCGLAAAETENPQLSIPRAVKQVFWRILLFYLVSMVMIGCMVPYTDSNLGTTQDGSASPFVIAIRRAGVHALPSIFNVVILLGILGVANAAVYGSTRTVICLAAQGHGPKWFLWIDRCGRPVAAIFLAFLFGLIGFVVATDNYDEAFNWLSNIDGMAGLIMWLSINACHIRFRRAMKAQNMSVDDLEYAAPFGEFGSWVGVIIVVVVLGLQFWVALFPTAKADAYSFFEVWLGFLVIIVFYVGHKLYYRDPMPSLHEIDLITGGRLSDLDEMRRRMQQNREYIASRPWWYRTFKFWC